MICKHCLKEINEDSAFCRHCGQKVDAFKPINEYEIRNETHSQMTTGKKKAKVPTAIKVGFFAYSAVIAAFYVFFGSAFVSGFVYGTDGPDDDVYTEAEYEEAEERESQDDENAGWFSDTSRTDKENDTTDANNAELGRVTYSSDNPNETDMPQTIPMLTYVLSFRDIEMSIDALDWYDFLYGEGYYDIGSVDDYYRDSSKGAFTFVPANETYNTSGDGIVDIKLDMNHPSFNFTRDDDTYYEEGFEFFSKVLNESDSYIDFSQYDRDGDGFVVPHELTIVFIFAGYEEYEDFDYPATTYSCSLIYDDYLTIDGIKIDECIYTAEKDPYNAGDQIAGIGILCHELGHALDLPDLYDTDYSSEGGVAFHDLMAAGCDNATPADPYGTYPAPLTAWEREFLGFEEPEIIEKDGTFTVYARSSDKYNILKVDDGEGYYLIENVDFKGFGVGLKDYLDSPGIAIWYVDKSVMHSTRRFYMNDVNDNEEKYGYMLIEANDTNHMSQVAINYQRSYDHYHYLSGDNIFVSDSGIQVEILDDPKNEMEVRITLPK